MDKEKVIIESKNSKELIIEVAIKLFAEKGYHSTTTQSICTEAKISSGLLFYYFKNKVGLLKEVVNYMIIKLDNLIIQDKKLHPRKQLESIINDFEKSLIQERPYWDIYLSLLYQPDTKEIILDQVIDHSKRFRRAIFDLFKELGKKDPSSDSFEFEIYRVGIFTAYLANHDEIILSKACNYLKRTYITKY